MKFYKALLLLITASILSISCFEDNDDNLITASEINDFVWKGMNLYYLYKDDVADLANDRFASDQEYADYLNGFLNPEDLFESLIYQRQTVDRFSWIVDDYFALEELFNGTTNSNGMEYGIFGVSSNTTNLYGYVRYVLPNTSAEVQGVKRGDIFYAVDGTPLTTSNWRTLLRPDNYTINLGIYDDNGTPETSDDVVTPSTESVALTKTQYTENPILINSVLDINNTKVAYLMYNGFTGTDQFNSELNSVFGSFKNANATELVLDLRYNPGGSVYTAILLSSMITGQFTGDVFSTEQWNSEFQEAFENNNPELLINRFVNNDDGATLNSLNLSKVYILTTGSSASASELVVNALSPYINVVQIGTTTTGKYQASVTLYDSENFGRQGANPNHTYAMQPLIYKSLNVNGVTDYFNGLSPNTNNVIGEDYNNLGVLGNVTEPLLAVALADIAGTGRKYQAKSDYLNTLFDSNDLIPFAKGMYTNKPLPQDILKRLSFK